MTGTDDQKRRIAKTAALFTQPASGAAASAASAAPSRDGFIAGVAGKLGSFRRAQERLAAIHPRHFVCWSDTVSKCAGRSSAGSPAILLAGAVIAVVSVRKTRPVEQVAVEPVIGA